MTPCIHSELSPNGNGYGVSKGLYAHRVAYEVAFGKIPEGLVVRHKCDNRICINPEHLELGTQADNVRDMRERGRAVNPPVHIGESNPKAKLKEAQVIDIFTTKDSHASAARRHGVTPEMVGLIRRGKSWRHLTEGLAMPE